MSLRDILVCIDDDKQSAARYRLASDLAGRFRAGVTGVFVEPRLPAPALGGFGGHVPSGVVNEMMRDHRQMVGQAADAAVRRFELAARDVRACSEPVIIPKGSTRAFFNAARCYDLVVCGARGVQSDPVEGLGAADVAMGAGGPVLIVPRDVEATSIGRRILVAWNGSREAARALRDAWPLLDEAEDIRVLVAGGREAGAEPLLQRRFERRGYKVDVTVDRSDGSAGEVIRAQARSFGADLVVMGLYGRSRMQEFVLGGVSRTMLGQHSLPLFVSH